MGGAKSKVAEINHRIATTQYDIIFCQESWFDGNISSNEVVHSTDFDIIRNDRSMTNNQRTKEGGIFTLARKKLNCEEIPHSFKTTGEFLCTKFTIEGHSFYAVNVYMPPYDRRLRTTMVNELARILKQIHLLEKDAEIVLIGDFNFSNIKWEFNEEATGILTPRDEEYAAHEIKFIETISAFSMVQIISNPNGEGKFLDLAFANVIENAVEFVPDVNDDISRLSTHHNSLGIAYTIPGTQFTPRREMNHINVNERLFTLQVNNTILPTEEQRGIRLEINQNVSREIVNDLATQLTEKIFAIQLSCTQKSLSQEHRPQSSHPWARGKVYKQLERNRRTARRMHRKCIQNWH